MDNLPLVSGFAVLVVVSLSVVLMVCLCAVRKNGVSAGFNTLVIPPFVAPSSPISNRAPLNDLQRRIGLFHATVSFLTCFPSHSSVRIICSGVSPLVFGPFGSFRCTVPRLA